MSYVYYSYFGAKEAGTSTTTFNWYAEGEYEYGTRADSGYSVPLGPDSQDTASGYIMGSKKGSMIRKLQNHFGNYSSNDNAYEQVQTLVSDGIDDLVGQMEPNTQEATDYMSVVDFNVLFDTFTTAFEATETQVDIALETTTVTVSETSY